MKEKIIIIDFGSQYSQLIARRIREINVYCEIYPPQITAAKIKALEPSGIIFSGGPKSLTQKNAPRCDVGIFNLNIPIMGVCYGMQLIAHHFKGKVGKSTDREYGKAELFIDNEKTIFSKIGKNMITWMSHEDKVTKLPKDFVILAHTQNARIASFAHKQKSIFGVQFHPEVVHTPRGKTVIENFVMKVCGCRGLWTMQSFISESIKQIREKVQDDSIVLGLSGGVDSSVAAVLLHKAIGKRLHCIFVNNGLLRLGEAKQVRKTFKKHYHMNFHYADAEKLFLDKLKGKLLDDYLLRFLIVKLNGLKILSFLPRELYIQT